MTQRLGLAKTLRFVVIKPDSTAEAQGGERRRRKGLFWDEARFPPPSPRDRCEFREGPSPERERRADSSERSLSAVAIVNHQLSYYGK
jgi:hypothetical protein